MHSLEQGEELSEEHQAIVPLSSTILRNEITLLQARPMDPSKDLSAYGYGSVAWKDRMETWKQRQNQLGNMRKDDNDNEDLDKSVDDDNEFPL